jgi:lactoylglutathione lyase
MAKGLCVNMKKIRNSFLLSLVVLLPVCLLFARSEATTKPPVFDHGTRYVRELQKSADFYQNVIGLERMPDPFKDATHIWFRAGAHEQLHLVGGAKEITDHELEVHLAFRVDSLDKFIARLEQMQVKYHNSKGDEKKITVRPDGVKQIYFQDPDGYWVEVNDNKF